RTWRTAVHEPDRPDGGSIFVQHDFHHYGVPPPGGLSGLPPDGSGNSGDNPTTGAAIARRVRTFEEMNDARRKKEFEDANYVVETGSRSSRVPVPDAGTAGARHHLRYGHRFNGRSHPGGIGRNSKHRHQRDVSGSDQ